MKSFDGRPSPELVRNTLAHHLNTTYGSHPPAEIEAEGRFHMMSWSTIYIYNVRRGGNSRPYVIKIPRFPDQTTPEVSWQSEELLRRGRREYNSIARIHNHFAAQDNPALRALHPEAYLADINAVVMNFVPSTTLYENTVMIRHLLSPTGRNRALKRLNLTGQWLGWLHSLPADSVDPQMVNDTSAGLTTLLAYAEQLSVHDSGPQTIPGWEAALALLRQARGAEPVWIHGDFHMGNILVLPDNAILSLDAVLNIVDDPCADIGKLVVDLRTRRERILSQGFLPPNDFIEQLIVAFLNGYETHRAAVNPLTLALYEGVYLLEKWLQCHATAEKQLTRTFKGVITPLINANINQVLARMTRDWVSRVQQLATQ